MTVLGSLLMGLGGILGLGGLVCFIMVVVKMFQNDQSTLGIITIITFFCSIGSIIALIVGWINAAQWKIKNLMMIYTACLLGSIILYFIGAGLFAAGVIQENPEFQQEFDPAMPFEGNNF